MNRYSRYVLIIFCAVTILLLGLIAYITVIFDANAYKAQIVQLVKDRMQRNLKLEGDIKIVFFPGIGVETGNLALSEYQSNEEFAQAEHIRVSLKMLPLLQKRLVVDEIAIGGLKANLIRFSNGHTNIHDLIATPAEPEQFEPEVVRIHLERTLFSLRDEMSGTHFLLKDLHLEAHRKDSAPGAAVNNGVENKVNLGFRAHGPEQLESDATLGLEFDLAVDKNEQRYALKNLNLQGEGRTQGIPRLAIQLTGGFSADFGAGPGKGKFMAEGMAVRIDAPKDGEPERGKAGVEGGFDLRLDVPRLILSNARLAGDRMTALVEVARPDSRTRMRVSLSDIRGTLDNLAAHALEAELETRRDDFMVKATLVSPLVGTVSTRQAKLPSVKGVIHVINPEAPGNALDARLAGNASMDGLSSHENVCAELEGKLADSKINAKLSGTGPFPGKWIFTVDIDQLNLDQLLPQLPAERFSSQWTNTGGRPQDLPFLDSLKDLNIRGSVRIGNLDVAGVHSSGVKLDIIPD